MSIVINDPQLEQLARQLTTAKGATIESIVRDGLMALAGHHELAAYAFERFGKGQRHPAQLNMGDCAVYALAKSLAEPLLFVGNDFSQTDVEQC